MVLQARPTLGLRTLAILLTLVRGFCCAVPARATAGEQPPAFVFYVASDIQGYAGPGERDSCAGFRGVAMAIDALGRGDFLASPGDVAPVWETYWTITSTLGSDYLWFPVVGNHELPDPASESVPGENLAWLHAYGPDPNGPGVPPDVVRLGPPGCPSTTYSFDYGDAHFVALNVYCDSAGEDATDGDVPEHLYEWLADDLASTDKTLIFVLGHEPAYPQRDAELNRIRHVRDSLNEHPEHRDRFWQLLKREGVTAYVCGHIHAYSSVRIDGVWQITTAHARGIQDAVGRSTFIRVEVQGDDVSYRTYRQDGQDPCVYELTDAWDSDSLARDIATPTPAPSPTPPPRGLRAALSPTPGWLVVGGIGVATLSAVALGVLVARRRATT